MIRTPRTIAEQKGTAPGGFKPARVEMEPRQAVSNSPTPPPHPEACAWGGNTAMPKPQE
jgi:hypothetical protein